MRDGSLERHIGGEWEGTPPTHTEEKFEFDVEKILADFKLPPLIRRKSRPSGKTVYIKNLRSRQYRLKDAIPIFIEEVEDGRYEATCFDVDQYGTGPSEEDSIHDLCKGMVEYFGLLTDEKTRLGKRLKWHYEYLTELIERR